jgi:hypothetical protein
VLLFLFLGTFITPVLCPYFSALHKCARSIRTRPGSTISGVPSLYLPVTRISLCFFLFDRHNYLLPFTSKNMYDTTLIKGDNNMDKLNKEALLDEVWKITLEASGGMEIPSEIQTKLELLDPMLDNALGLNKEGVRRSINYGLSKSQ